VKLSLSLAKCLTMKTFCVQLCTTSRRRIGGEGGAPRILTSVLGGSEWSDSRPDRFTPEGRAPCCRWDRRLGGLQCWSPRGSEEN